MVLMIKMLLQASVLGDLEIGDPVARVVQVLHAHLLLRSWWIWSVTSNTTSSCLYRLCSSYPLLAGMLASSAYVCPLQSPLCCRPGPGRKMEEKIWELKAGRCFQDLCFPFCFLVVLRPGKAKIQVFLSVAYNEGFLSGLWLAFLLSSWGRKRDLSTFYNPVRNSFEHEYVLIIQQSLV